MDNINIYQINYYTILKYCDNVLLFGSRGCVFESDKKQRKILRVFNFMLSTYSQNVRLYVIWRMYYVYINI